MQARRAFSPITLALTSAKMPYKWGFPTKLFIHRDHTMHVETPPRKERSSYHHGKYQLKKLKGPHTYQDLRRSQMTGPLPLPHEEKRLVIPFHPEF
ncbi:hypothetical protein GDO78_022367 [Eleutherodactylus coqui]|uniref:Uncharacterized protein n=1 Tax=Eleutherodactylus coqui TaxID=57060 RepID=A0A8J6EG60_ELECQ|nr:hypothetical protein GDO78_022367 [Eleutherodactylus coqui]